MLAEVFLQTALAFLAREVPQWPRENHCYSCHNNGDAARVLYLGRKLGYNIPAEALRDTTAWLRKPARWDEIHGAPAASDKNLGRIQFTAALAEAVQTGAVRDRTTLRAAARALATLQRPDGSWQVDTGGLPGAPATYGTGLATYLSRRSLQVAGTTLFAGPIERATRWLASAVPQSTLDAAALLLAQPGRADCRQKLLDSQTSDGGWGPQAKMPAEAFDTALAVLALRGQGPEAARGRAWLLKMQESDGGWPETTRPSGLQSYAERISTTAWVVYALLQTAY
ncbi:MAG: prenyltransferase/squalene oxidase repeat-containing protein [Candidatus Solibacter sp.]